MKVALGDDKKKEKDTGELINCQLKMKRIGQVFSLNDKVQLIIQDIDHMVNQSSRVCRDLDC